MASPAKLCQKCQRRNLPQVDRQQSGMDRSNFFKTSAACIKARRVAIMQAGLNTTVSITCENACAGNISTVREPGSGSLVSSATTLYQTQDQNEAAMEATIETEPRKSLSVTISA